VVVNLTDVELPPEERAVLSLGTKFALPPPLPVLDLVARCQHSVDIARNHARSKGCGETELARFENNAAKILQDATKAPRAPVHPLHSTVRSLAGDAERVFVPADKAKALVVLDRAVYESKVLGLLVPPSYLELPSDPSKAFNAQFIKALREAFRSKVSPEHRGSTRWDTKLEGLAARVYHQVRRTHGRPGAFYALVKTHKFDHPPTNEQERKHWIDNLKLRPILPGFKSIDGPLAAHLTEVLQCLPRPPLSINSPLEALTRLSKVRGDDFLLISLDVVSMFPSIPTDEALDILLPLLQTHRQDIALVTPLSPEQVCQFLSLSFSNTFAAVADGGRTRFFKQTQGLAMGKSYSPEVANLFMGHWEKDLDRHARAVGASLVFAMRYADDYCIGFKGSKAQLKAMVVLLNSLNPYIKVELEIERGRQLSFLDLLLSRGPSGITTGVFRKASYTGQVVPYNSFCEARYKEAGIRSDVTRALRYCSSPAAIRKELDFIRAIYHRAGYPHWLITKVATQAQRAHIHPKPTLGREDTIFFSIPFVGPTFHRLRKEAAKVGIRLVSRTSNTLGARLNPKLKAPTPHLEKADVVYQINCSCGAIYVGETGQELQSRVGQHRAAHRRQDPRSAFGLPAHVDCQPDFDGVQILAQEPHQRLRLLKESALIRTATGEVIRAPNDDALNRNAGVLLPDRWLPALSALV
jgi:hypothetical protein